MSGFGVRRSTGVKYTDKFLNTSDTMVTNYDLDKAIETITHETRHQLQSECKNDGWFFGMFDNQMSNYQISQQTLGEWSQPYIAYDHKKGSYPAYWSQPVEVDARLFAALSQMN